MIGLCPTHGVTNCSPLCICLTCREAALPVPAVPVAGHLANAWLSAAEWLQDHPTTRLIGSFAAVVFGLGVPLSFILGGK